MYTPSRWCTWRWNFIKNSSELRTRIILAGRIWDCSRIRHYNRFRSWRQTERRMSIIVLSRIIRRNLRNARTVLFTILDQWCIRLNYACLYLFYILLSSEYRTSSEANIPSVGQDISHLYWNQDVHSHFHKSQELVLILSQWIPVYVFTARFCKLPSSHLRLSLAFCSLCFVYPY